jgi:hypothetical protein
MFDVGCVVCGILKLGLSGCFACRLKVGWKKKVEGCGL